MNPDRVAALPFVERVHCFDRIASTNTFARELTEAPATGIFVVTARRQSAGRGQRGNSFYSDTADGLWLSLVVALPDIGGHFGVNRALAVAAVDALRATSGSDACRIKWPNDIYWGERKMGGMLLEASTARPGVLVAGLGLNINTDATAFPAGIRDVATSLVAQTGRRSDVEALLIEILIGFDRLRHLAPADAHARYCALLLGLGRAVCVGGETGRLDSVGEDGRACVVGEGRRQYHSSGPLRFVGDDRAVG
jgi:biotin-[acetyl-CoA-carboxylase] ligase BirA-like protein